MRSLSVLLLLVLLALPRIASAAARPADEVPADARWALVATTAGAGAAFAASLDAAADSRGLLGGFAAGLRNSVGWNPADAAALEAAGVALDRPLSIASLGDVELGAVHLRDAAAAERHLATWLAGAGETTSAATHRGWQIRTARREGRLVAAAAVRAGRAVTVRGVAPGADPLQAVHRAIDAAHGERSLAGEALFQQVPADAGTPLRLWRRHGGDALVLRLRLEEGARLRLDGRARVPGAAGVLGSRAAFPTATPGADLLLVRLDLSPNHRSVQGGIRWLLEQACPACPARFRAEEAQAAVRLLAGPAALAVSRLDLRAVEGDRLGPAATPFAWVAQVRDAAAAGAWLDRVGARLGGTATNADDRVVETAIGRLHFGLRGARLYVASDPALRDRLLAATSGTVQGPGEPLQATLSPARIGESLAALTMSDVLRGGLLGGLFALRLQLGAMLRSSGPLHLRARPAGRDSFHLDSTWDLRAAP